MVTPTKIFATRLRATTRNGHTEFKCVEYNGKILLGTEAETEKTTELVSEDVEC